MLASITAPTSAFFGAKLPAASSALASARKPCGMAVIECSSRPQKKATAHHRKTRPRKTQPWDVRRKPTVYAALPPLPPDWVLEEAAGDAAEADSSEAAVVDDAPPAS